MINDLFSVLQQLAGFTAIPFIVYLISNKTWSGFFDYIGLKKSNKKANLLAALLMVVFAAPIFVFALVSEEFLVTLKDPNSVTGKFSAMGPTPQSVLLLVLMAVIKTALAEEILFRGFIAKRLIAVINFRIGNIIHAFLFGLIHFLLFLNITDNVFFLGVIFVFPTIGAYLKVYLNEKLADGSIVPGWIAHALANLFSYSVIGFLL